VALQHRQPSPPRRGRERRWVVIAQGQPGAQGHAGGEASSASSSSSSSSSFFFFFFFAATTTTVAACFCWVVAQRHVERDGAALGEATHGHPRGGDAVLGLLPFDQRLDALRGLREALDVLGRVRVLTEEMISEDEERRNELNEFGHVGIE
jgi:hypothetical protein